MTHEAQIVEWMKTDPRRWQLLGHVRSLNLPDCWVGAGFVRDMVWAKVHGFDAPLGGDIDVIWFDPMRTIETLDRDLEHSLRQMDADADWSVKNQARMHVGNGDQPYSSAGDAIRHWPEHATAIAVRRTESDTCEVHAPYGVSDLFDLIIRPTADFVETKRDQFDERVARKEWLSRFPRLNVIG